jgi:hypothetical protein
MKTSLLCIAASCCALAVSPSARAQPNINVDIGNVGLHIGPPPPIVVHRAPPRPRVERRIEAPGPGYVWIAGHNTWRNGDWVWQEGVWVRPPQANATWVEPRWDERSQTWIDGYWSVQNVSDRDRDRYDRDNDRNRDRDRDRYDRNDDRDRDDHFDRGDEVTVIDAPPPPRQEVRVRAPGPGFVWVSGYWIRRHHRYVWVEGRWARPPHGRGHWYGPHWERRGGNYVFIEGSWR